MTTGTSRFEQAYSRDMRTSGARSASDGVPPRAQNACGNGGPVSGPTRARQHVICISLRAHKTPCKCRLRHCAPTCSTPTHPRRHAVCRGLAPDGGKNWLPATQFSDWPEQAQLTGTTSAQKSFDQDDGQGARRGQPVILDGLPCTSRDRDREVAASARCGSSGQQGCGFSLRTPSCPVLSIRTRSPLPDRPSPA